jgi:hypothetical protein
LLLRSCSENFVDSYHKAVLNAAVKRTHFQEISALSTLYYSGREHLGKILLGPVSEACGFQSGVFGTSEFVAM